MWRFLQTVFRVPLKPLAAQHKPFAVFRKLLCHTCSKKWRPRLIFVKEGNSDKAGTLNCVRKPPGYDARFVHQRHRKIPCASGRSWTPLVPARVLFEMSCVVKTFRAAAFSIASAGPTIPTRSCSYRRHLRFDATHSRYFFLPKDGYPKRISWNIGGKWVSREVTTRHMIKRLNANGEKESVQFGWRQQGIHANFALLPSGLFLRIEPTWLLTKPDGKAARGGRRVGPILSHWLNQERNGQILRSLRFWSLVLSRGGNEIVIGTGQEPIRIGLVQDSGYTRIGILSDQMDYDSLMKTEMEDDLNVPQLGLFRGNESI